MNAVIQRSISAPLIWGILFWGAAALAAEPAKVRIGVLPVYAGPSVTSGIVKFLKREEVVEILLAHGADGKAKNKDGLTALGLSKRITASRRRSLAEAQEANRKEELAELRKGLARHEAVLRLLEKSEGG